MPTDILLVRHGQTTSNLTRFYMGWSEEDLNETGMAQVRRLSARLAGLPIAAVYSSPLTRARTTASILAEPHQLEIKPFEDLIEIKFGDWQGLSLEEIRRRWPEIWKGWREKPSEESIPGGESFAQVAKRALRALETIIQENRDSRVAIVSHEIILKILIIQALNSHFDIYRRFVVDNASLSQIKMTGNWLHAVSINDTSHLEGLA